MPYADDDDTFHLPPGMTRIGYDADTETYTFRDADGTRYEGTPGSRYGQLTPTGVRSSAPFDDVVTQSARESDWKQLAPFLLLIAVVLLSVMWFVTGAEEARCRNGEQAYVLDKRNTCWQVARDFGVEVGRLRAARGDLDCDHLQIGTTMCVDVTGVF